MLVGGGTTTTLPDDQNASIALPQSLFADLELVTTMTVGIGFTFYETAALFPLPEGSPPNLNIGSPVIGAFVASQNVSDLHDPIIIIFHLTQPVCMLTFIVVFQSHCQPAYTSDACRTLTQGVSAGTATAGESKSHLYGVESNLWTKAYLYLHYV